MCTTPPRATSTAPSFRPFVALPGPRRARISAASPAACLVLFGLFLTALLPLPFTHPAHAESPRVRSTSPIDLGLYARLLLAHTRPVPSLAGTTVDYASLVRSKELDTLVAQVKAGRPSTLGHHARLAFWINAYNILTLDLVRRHHPVASIKDIGSFFSPVWKIELATIEGRPISLDTIEHEILRPEGDPRIHGAIVCASKSCPPLLRRPFRPEALDADLDFAIRAWLASPVKGVSIDRAAKEVRVSKLFKWFEDDFEAKGGVRAVIARYVSPADAIWLKGPGRHSTLRYFEYDWSLNGS